MEDNMENINIRNYIMENFKNDSPEKIADSIETTLKFQDEDALIGLGVLFELVWQKSNKEEQAKYLDMIYECINEK